MGTLCVCVRERDTIEDWTHDLIYYFFAQQVLMLTIFSLLFSRLDFTCAASGKMRWSRALRCMLTLTLSTALSLWLGWRGFQSMYDNLLYFCWRTVHECFLISLISFFSEFFFFPMRCFSHLWRKDYSRSPHTFFLKRRRVSIPSLFHVFSSPSPLRSHGSECIEQAETDPVFWVSDIQHMFE